MDLSGTYEIGKSISCYFIDYGWPPIKSVGVAYPFAVTSEPPPVLYGCQECTAFGIMIALPQQPGGYDLTGTVSFS